MPIFVQDLERRDSAKEDPEHGLTGPSYEAEGWRDARPISLTRKLSEESIRTEFCDGPIPDGPIEPQSSKKEVSPTCTDRAELIERLKRGESPTWVPSRHFDSFWSQRSQSPTKSPRRSPAASPTLLPPATITSETQTWDSTPEDGTRYQDGLNIERPRSALHSGDFTQDETTSGIASPSRTGRQVHKQQDLADSGHPWTATSPPENFTPFRFEQRQLAITRSDVARAALSPLSTSIATSFAYKPPTSPLAHSATNDDSDGTSPMAGVDIGSNRSRLGRRHSLMVAHSTSYGFPPNLGARHPPSFRPDRTFPSQAHQPRRSLASIPNFSSIISSPLAPAHLQFRRQSYGSDVSPIQHASMVGSYEESILRGRMSTTPSKPLDFVAQIGVLGLGKCKSSLRCPPHVTLPFPAVFYSYANSSHGRSKDEDGPSPYVGQIDLENGISNQEDEARSRRKVHSRVADRGAGGLDDINTNDRRMLSPEPDVSRSQRPTRRSGSPRAPPGGSYRIPEKGQIQIIIKNPNKTAVKLFLVPYDLAGMELGTKTFIRQRSYSNGAIVESIPGLKKSSAADRPVLRYLVHLHICCPSRGRYYLYKSIRVVFANRVPDGKENLRNEITLPGPRFTPYKPIRAMHPPISSGPGLGADLVAYNAFRRRSSGFYIGGSNQGLNGMDPLAPPRNMLQHESFSYVDSIPGESTPFSLTSPRIPWNETFKDTSGLGSFEASINSQSYDSSRQTEHPTIPMSDDASISWVNADGSPKQAHSYGKLHKGDAGYGGPAFANSINGSPVIAESLLSQRLRSLEVEQQTSSPPAVDISPKA